MNDRRRKTTREEILKLEPGPELDRLVAEKVMEWEKGKDFDCGREGSLVRYPFRNRALSKKWSPSTDIAAAWGIVLHVIKTLDCNVRVISEVCLDPSTDKRVIMWYVVLEPYSKRRRLAEFVKGVSRDSLPLAICRAALLAVMEADNGEKGGG